MPDEAPLAFISYESTADANNAVTTLREHLETELKLRLDDGASIFQDKESIKGGQDWHEQIIESLERVVILIPIVTPSLFNSEHCREELLAFKRHESEGGDLELVLPLLFVETPGIGADDRKARTEPSDPDADPLVTWLAKVQYEDWTKLRLKIDPDEEYGFAISALSKRLVEMAQRATNERNPHALAAASRVFVVPNKPAAASEPVAPVDVSSGASAPFAVVEGGGGAMAMPRAKQSEKPAGQLHSSSKKGELSEVKRRVTLILVAASAMAVGVSGLWILIENCGSAEEPLAICEFLGRGRVDIALPGDITPEASGETAAARYGGTTSSPPKQPTLVSLEDRFYVFAEKPVTTFAAPEKGADSIEELQKGHVFDNLWKVQDTEWYAYDSIDGKKAFFRGDVVLSLDLP